MKIFSPSYKRSEGVKTHLLIPDVIYCVAENEKKDYLKHGYNIETMPNEVNGNIARVRNYMLKHFVKDKGIIIDDDIEGLKMWTKKYGVITTIDIEDIEEFIEQGFNLCKEFGARLWGINILGDKGSYREYTPFSLTNPISASFMGFLKTDLKFDERIPLKEDYDYCIQNMNKYRKVLRLNYIHMIKKDHKNLGGCADYRTIEKEKEQLKILQNKWGKNIVKNDFKASNKRKESFDINPILKIPINGV